MVKSINTAVELTVNATWYRGMPSYGQVMVGDRAFEFYNERNVGDYVQIPWNQITYVVADVHFGGRYIPRFEIRTKNSGNFIFNTRDPKKTLRAIREHVPADRLRKSLTVMQKLRRNFSKH